MNGQCRSWIDKATTDLAIARHIYDTFHPMPCNQICERCHLVAELAIKAVLYNITPGIKIEKTHDLLYLILQHDKVFDVTTEMNIKIGYLNQFATKTKYPNELQIDAGMTGVAIRYAEQIYDWAQEIIRNYDLVKSNGKS